jgi:hypothetical protein
MRRLDLDTLADEHLEPVGGAVERVALGHGSSVPPAGLQPTRAPADDPAVDAVREIALELIAAAAAPDERRPLYVLRPEGSAESTVRELPAGSVASSDDFLLTGMTVVQGTIAGTGARSAGLLVPIRTLWGATAVCEQLDAEAFAIVTAQGLGDLAGSVGIACPVHLLPNGWRESHAELDWLATPLRRAVAHLPLASEFDV